MRKVLLHSLILAAALAPALSADVLFVPIPDVGGIQGANLQTTIEVANHNTANSTLNLAFVGTGKDGSAAVGNSNSFPANRTVTSDVTHLIGSAGLLKVTDNSAGIALGQAAFYVNKGSENAPWNLPVVSSANQFDKGAIAFVNDLRRDADGVSNLEIVNLGSVATTCAIDLFDASDVSILPVLSATVLPQGHGVTHDVLHLANLTEIQGVRAQVSCDQPFYAYGTFVSSDFTLFRMFPPLTAATQPAGKTVAVDMGGLFFTSNSSHPNLDLPLPLAVGVEYRRVTIDFDMNIRNFTPLFSGILGMFHAGGPRFGKTLYFGFNIRGVRGRMLGDLGQPTLEAAVKRNVTFVEGGAYHMKVIYDVPTHAILFYATNNKTGNVVMDALVGNFNWDVIDTGGAPVRIQFGLPGIADGAYYPPKGWKFSNLHVRATP